MAEQAFLSSLWYRVANLRPSLKPHADIAVHRYQGRIWYVLRESASTRVHRISPAAYAVIGAFDGDVTVDDAWLAAAERLGDDGPTQDEIINVLVQAYRADLLTVDLPPSSRELFERQEKQRRARWTRALKNPLAITIPLINPDRFLAGSARLLSAIPTFVLLTLWLALVVPAAALAVLHSKELSGSLNDQIWSMQNLVLIAAVFPLIKLWHEFGHGVAARACGASVREAGVMLLAVYPVPYVDVSDSIFVASKWRRFLVGAAGMAFEVSLAALALYGWLAVEDGPVRAVLFNVMLVAGFSTVVVNGNPLLRFDAYYMLADALEIPNLAQRANRWWGALVERFAFGRRHAAKERSTGFEQVVYFLFAPASYAYRIVVVVSIALFVAAEYLLLGVIIGAWSVFMAVVMPAWRILKHVFTSPSLTLQRGRAVSMTLGAILLIILGLTAVPIPSRSTAEGVVWLPDDAAVRAGAPGFAQVISVGPGEQVRAGQPLGRMEDPTLATRIEGQTHKVAEMRARMLAETFGDQSRLEIARREYDEQNAQLDRLKAQADRLDLVAGADGRFFPISHLLPDGRFFREGETLGHVVPPQTRLIRIVVDQADVDRVRGSLRSVAILTGPSYGEARPASLTREVPAARQQLPHRALGSAAGGAIPVDPRDQQGLTTLRRVFQFDALLQEPLKQAGFGARVQVRFSYAWESLWTQAARRARQLFLTTFQA